MTRRKAAKRKMAGRTGTARKAALRLPPILLEGDYPNLPPVSGPGEKFVLGPTPPAQSFPAVKRDLPAAYGTGRLFMVARDPHWLYAHWDLEPQQRIRYNARSEHGHLILRVHAGEQLNQPTTEIHVHPESHHWFAHVEQAASPYIAELGYYRSDHTWTRIATSGVTVTPPNTVSSDTSVSFATIPVELSFEKLAVLIWKAAGENLPLAQAVESLRRQGHPELPAISVPEAVDWSAEQRQAMAEIIDVDALRRVWIGSLEITELISRQIQHEISSLGAAQLGMPFPPPGEELNISSPVGGAPSGAKSFWLNVNAELIIYGATEPDATVTLGGRSIRLRPDGTFSFRFALPDGNYDLPIVAVSASQEDSRAVELHFNRSTEDRGEVGTQPSDPTLNPPSAENV